METLLTIFSLIPFYLIGCFPSGRLIASRSGVAIDKQGSGNVGATNVARVLGKKAGLITLLADVGKGMFATALADLVSGNIEYAALAAFAAVAGHCFSIPGKMKGGKGVATALGAYLFLSPLTAACGVAIFGLVMVGTRIVSLSSICAALLMPLAGLLLMVPTPVVFPLAGVSLLVVYRHHENIVRLIEGREKKFSSTKESPSTAEPQ
jgi:glycerol-3-phosphate acyltransferase PlsY